MIGRVLTMEPEPQKNGKTINWCTVDVGDANGTGEPQGIVCGAHNFAVGDLVVVVLPGGVLPGGFEISARKTYGHVSAGMICSTKELGLGEDHDGILVLPADAGEPGDDVFDLLRLRDEVIEFEINPDRAYALSLRGVAREAALAYGVAFHDPADRDTPPADDDGYPVEDRRPRGLPGLRGPHRLRLRPDRAHADWMARRLVLLGQRPISLAVDVTNYVMFELGRPIHGYDADKLTGPIRVRRAAEGERLTTLDGNDRALSPEDLVVTDDSGIIGLGGVMGGANTEMSRDHHARPDRVRALGRRVDVPHRPAAQAHLRGRQAQRARRRPDHLRGRGRPGGRAARRARRRHRSSPASPSSARLPRRPRSRSRSTCPARITGMDIASDTTDRQPGGRRLRRSTPAPTR